MPHQAMFFCRLRRFCNALLHRRCCWRITAPSGRTAGSTPIAWTARVSHASTRGCGRTFRRCTCCPVAPLLGTRDKAADTLAMANLGTEVAYLHGDVDSRNHLLSLQAEAGLQLWGATHGPSFLIQPLYQIPQVYPGADGFSRHFASARGKTVEAGFW